MIKRFDSVSLKLDED